MFNVITFPQTHCLSKGRNGFAYSCGIQLTDFREELMMETIGSRGDAGAARLVVPLSHIPALQAALAAFVAECEADAAAKANMPIGFVGLSGVDADAKAAE